MKMNVILLMTKLHQNVEYHLYEIIDIRIDILSTGLL